MDMEVSPAAVEDDLFFADLSHRISLLITEEDEEFPAINCPVKVVPFQAYNQANQPFFQPSPFFYEASYKRETKGTGVFIPKSSFPKRKNRSGRSRQNDNKTNNKASSVVVLPSNTTTSTTC